MPRIGISIILDEAHHARRRRRWEYAGESAERATRADAEVAGEMPSLLLLTATPMQVHRWSCGT